MVVLLVGKYMQHEFDLLREEIESKNVGVEVINTDDWPSNKPITHSIAGGEISVGNVSLLLSEVEGLFVRQNGLFIPSVEDHQEGFVSEDENPYAALTQLREYRGFFRSLVRGVADTGGRVAPGVDALSWQEESIHACHLLARNSIETPESIVTTDEEEAVNFLKEQGKVVYKPVAELGEANLMKEEESHKLADLTTPVLFQELVPGEDVRAYVVNGEFVGAFRYVNPGDGFSFKMETDNPEVAPVDLNSEAVADIRRSVSLSPLNFAAVDLRFTSTQEHTVLEVNAGGRFMLADSKGVTNVTSPLAGFLTES